MYTYLSIILIPAFFSLTKFSKYKTNSFFFCLSFSLLLIIILGLRHKIGGDWLNYFFIYNNINEYFNPYSLNFLESDYVFDLINWLSFNNSLGFHFVNLINTLIFVFGIFYFAIKQPQPSMVFLVSVPYLLIVVSTGYVRQASALGIFLFAFSFLLDKKYFLYLISILVASLFHKTAFLLLGFIFVSQSNFNVSVLKFNKININYLIILITIILLTFIFFNFFLSFQYKFIIRNYIGIDQHFISTGAFFRSAIFVIASILCLIFYKNLTENNNEKKMYIFMSITILFLFPFVFYFSSAVDRVLIYFYPLQLFIFSRLHILFKDKNNRIFYNLLVISFFLLQFFIWIYFGKYSNHWIPYKNIMTQF